MSDVTARVLRWTDDRLAAILRAPRMWGSLEAVEMQTLLLLELRVLALRPGAEPQGPASIFQSYVDFLRGRFPGHPAAPLSEIVNDEAALVQAIEAFRREVEARFLVEDPFQHVDLAARLRFKHGAAPTAMSVAGYAEDLRRATRAFARSPDKTAGRVRKEIEEFTDFVLHEVRVTPPNGVNAEALLLLGRGHPAQEELFAEREVRRALASLAVTAEWVNSDAAVDELAIDDPTERVRAAVQTLRILPKRDLLEVTIGGELLGASRPRTLRASDAVRCAAIIAAHAEAAPFEKIDEIRAIDLDRGIVVLGREAKVTCYAANQMLGSDVREVGVRARVVGTHYKQHLASSFVLADSIQVLEAPEPAPT